MEENFTQGSVDPQTVELNFEVNTLRQKLMQANQIIERLSDDRALARINFLFKLLKYNEMFSAETVNKAVEEITAVMFPVEEPVENE